MFTFNQLHEAITNAESSLIKRMRRKISVSKEFPWMKDRFTSDEVSLGSVLGTLKPEDFIGYAYEDQSYDNVTMKWHCLDKHGISKWMLEN